jgi:hypothetical protein
MVQNSGSLAEQPLGAILESVQQDRATGTLHLRSGDRQATLYFLFGHLFHAVDGDRSGEDVVYDGLAWTEGDFTFDSKAKLPAEESIKVSTAELLAGRNGEGNPAPPPTAEASTETAEPEEEAEEPQEPAGLRVPVETSDRATERASGGQSTGPQKRRRTDVRPETRPPESMQLYPVPLGKLIYEALTAGFVDFPKLLRSLSKDGHTGYVRLSGDSFTGVLLFSSGAVVEALYETGGQVSTGREAFQKAGHNIDEGEGVLDVIQLTTEMVTAMYQLLTSPSLYEKLLGRFIRADALLEYLREIRSSGAVIVRADQHTGIVLLREGEVLGAYSDGAREISSDPGAVLALCDAPHAEVEVRGGPVPSSLPVMDPGKGPAEVPSGTSGAAAPPSAPANLEPSPMPEPAPMPEATPLPETAPPMEEAPAPAESSDGATEMPVEEAPVEAVAEPGAEEVDRVDWAAIVNQMASRADEVLGTRAKKVKEMLYSTNPSRPDIEQTLDRISELSIMFVDPSKLTALAEDMRRIVASPA